MVEDRRQEAGRCGGPADLVQPEAGLGEEAAEPLGIGRDALGVQVARASG